MSKITYDFQIEVETDNLPEKELAEMIATALAEGAEANTDDTTTVESITYTFKSELTGSGEFKFAKDELPVDGLGFES